MKGKAMHDQTRVATVSPKEAEQLLENFCLDTGYPLKDQYEPDEVVDILRRLGYDATVGTIPEFLRKNYISDPGDAWDAVAICNLACAMFARRRWLPAPSMHDPCKTDMRLEIERLQSAGVDPVIVDLDQHTIEDLLLRIVQPAHHKFENYVESLGLNPATLTAQEQLLLQRPWQHACHRHMEREAYYEFLRLKLAGFEE
jgi:hypothetical protein